jgi:16S rRNA C967 or C1407 C5-methylase (RsmB/RsmF family)
MHFIGIVLKAEIMTTPFPESFKKRMQAKLGGEWEQFDQAHQESSPVSIRVNAAKPTQSFSVSEKISWAEHGYYLHERPVFTLDPTFHAGCYYVQEASSMFLEQAILQHIPKEKGLKILDLCAAPGGKSTHLLSLLPKDSLIVSNEVIRSRVNVLSENIQKWGYPNVVVTSNDPSDFSSLTGLFDVIVIDAPCSGEGLFRKDPQAMQEWSEQNVAICAQRQRRIVEDIWPSVKENGILIYSTCTYNELEDEGTLQWINENYSVRFLPINPGMANVEKVDLQNILAYRCYPHRVKGEGFFISVLQKLESTSPLTLKPAKTRFAAPEKRTVQEINRWLLNNNVSLIQRNDLVQLLPASHVELIHLLSLRLHVIYAGTFIASVKHNKLVPEHSFALSTELNKDFFPSTSLSEKEALQYLKKETLSINTEHRGFSLATYNGIPIGWMNLLQGRINNLYPQEWRIRMKI